MKAEKHPMQPIVEEDGIFRFKENSIVRYLLANNGLNADLNHLRTIPFSDEDWNQFYQLIGYSVSGFGELSLADPKTVKKADKKATKLYRKQLREKLK